MSAARALHGFAASPALDVAALFDAHAPFVHRVAQRLTGSTATADDVVQEVFLLAHRRRQDLAELPGIRTWLYRATVLTVRQRRRGESRYASTLGKLGGDAGTVVPTPDQALSAKEQGLRIRTCIADLSESQREVFVLFELEDLDGADIAAILDVPLNTVWSRLRLARAGFRARWAGEPQEGG